MNSRKSIFSIKTDGAWWKGEIVIRYNLKKILKAICLIVLLPLILLYFLCKWIVRGVKYIAPYVKSFLVWIGGLLAALWAWIRLRTKRKPKTDASKKEKENKRVWLWALLLLLLVLLFLLWRSCNREKDKPTPLTVIENVYEQSFNDVIISRAYLDGVQEAVSKYCPRALVGFKFINDQPVKDYNFEGLTYDQSIKVVSNDWNPLVTENLKSANISHQQMVVITLAAMRMGKYGFSRSTFLKKINAGDFEGATQWLLLQDEKGNVMKTGDEPKQYFYMLRLLWTGRISVADLLNFPMFSYKGITVKEMYDEKGNIVFNNEIKDKLKGGNYKTPRQALGL